MGKPPERIGILTGGGDCPGLNAVLRAVTKDAITYAAKPMKRHLKCVNSTILQRLDRGLRVIRSMANDGRRQPNVRTMPDQVLKVLVPAVISLMLQASLGQGRVHKNRRLAPGNISCRQSVVKFILAGPAE